MANDAAATESYSPMRLVGMPFMLAKFHTSGRKHTGTCLLAPETSLEDRMLTLPVMLFGGLEATSSAIEAEASSK